MSAYITWHNDDTNETQIWLMTSTAIKRRATVHDENGRAIFVGPPWRIVAAVNTEIIWHNDATNETQIWFMTEHLDEIVRRATVQDENGKPIFVGPPWRIAGAAQMREAEPPSIIWHNDSTNETQIWFMSGDRIARRATVQDENGRPIFVGPPWRIVGAWANRIDWHNDATNETQIWHMSHEAILSRATVQDEKVEPIFVGPPWHVVGAADFQDFQDSGPAPFLRHADIAWHNDATNETQIWLTSEDRIARRATVQDENGQPIFVGAPWHIVATANANI
jgi:hypothetical protein